VRVLWPAFAFVAAVLVVPSAIVAQQPIAAPLPARPTTQPYPRPSYRPGGHRPGQRPYTYGNGGVLIDGSVINRYLRTPAPAPAPKRKATPRPKDAPDVFEEHSTDDNK
jgi:hypothetical protein